MKDHQYPFSGTLPYWTPEDPVTEMIDTVCRNFQIPSAEIYTQSRKREVTEVRAICMYVLRNRTTLTLRQIGERLGGIDKSRVHESILTVSGRMDVYPDMKRLVEIIQLSVQ